MVQRAATDLLSSPQASLALALGGSLLLHLGVLFGFPAPTPGASRSGQQLTVQLAVATPAVAQAARRPATEAPVRHVHPPHRARVLTRVASNKVIPEPAPMGTPPTPPAAEPVAAPHVVAVSNEPALSASTYYQGAQLDSPPHLLGAVQQIYPARARAADVEGSVTLSLLIDAHGRVDDISVISAQPPGYFEKAALNMLRKQRFAPALIHNHPVKSRWRTVVLYRLQS